MKIVKTALVWFGVGVVALISYSIYPTSRSLSGFLLGGTLTLLAINYAVKKYGTGKTVAQVIPTELIMNNRFWWVAGLLAAAVFTTYGVASGSFILGFLAGMGPWVIVLGSGLGIMAANSSHSDS